MSSSAGLIVRAVFFAKEDHERYRDIGSNQLIYRNNNM